LLCYIHRVSWAIEQFNKTNTQGPKKRALESSTLTLEQEEEEEKEDLESSGVVRLYTPSS